MRAAFALRRAAFVAAAVAAVFKIDGDIIALVIIGYRAFNRFFGKDRAVQFCRGQTVERFNDGFVCQGQRFFY